MIIVDTKVTVLSPGRVDTRLFCQQARDQLELKAFPFGSGKKRRRFHSRRTANCPPLRGCRNKQHRKCHGKFSD